jgi:acetate kinase
MDSAWVPDLAIDPGVILYLFQTGSLRKEVETILYKKSGLLGISGISNDMRDLLASSEPGAQLALDYFVYRAAKEIGRSPPSWWTGRTGVHRRHWRKLRRNPPRICESSAWLGIDLDEEANARKGPHLQREK